VDATSLSARLRVWPRPPEDGAPRPGNASAPLTQLDQLRVVFVNRFYAPDISASSQLLTDLAEALASSGVRVCVVCSRQLYELPRAGLNPRETLRGVSISRVGGTSFGRDRLLGRALDYATFYLAVFWLLVRALRHTDVLVTKTDPPLLSVIGAWVCRFSGATAVNWLQDVFPEVASRLGLLPLPSALERLVCRTRDHSLLRAKVNVVLGTRMQQYLVERGIPAEQIVVSENWADEGSIYPLLAADSVLRRRLGLLDRFVVAYSGNLGRAHDVNTLLEAATLMKHDEEIVFLMIGGGSNMRWLQTQARERGLRNLQFLPYQSRETLADSLAAGDVHLVSMLPTLEGLLVPSKLYGILAAGRPVVFIGDPEGELAQLVRESRIGLSVPCGDARSLRDALHALRDDEGRRLEFARRSRALLLGRFTLNAAVGRWLRLLESLALRESDSARNRDQSGT
jgi:colanic acid biosynthesis glycosyl transferase WcaI